MTTPNKITIGRILLIPVFVMFALYYGRSVARGEPVEWLRWTAVAVFVIAAASDGVDGYIARRYNQMSKLGVILDPFADKGLLLAGIITLTFGGWQYEFPLWFPVLVISRDIIVVSGALVIKLLNGSFVIRPSLGGKIATVTQMVAIGFAMLLPTLPWKTTIAGIEIAFLDVPVIVAALATLISGLGYARYGLRNVHESGHGEPKTPGEMQE